MNKMNDVKNDVKSRKLRPVSGVSRFTTLFFFFFLNNSSGIFNWRSSVAGLCMLSNTAQTEIFGCEPVLS